MNRSAAHRSSWLAWPVSGLLAGVLTGLLDGLAVPRLDPSLNLPPYFTHLTAVQYGLLGVLGGLAGRVVALLRPLRFLAPHPFAAMLPFSVGLVVLGLGNRHFFGSETAPSSLAFDAVVLALILAASLGLPRVLRGLESLRTRTSVLLRLGLTAALLVAFSPRGWSGADERGAAAGAAYAGPNVLILMLDTQRADHVGWAGYPRSPTPNLDALVRRGVTFSQLVTHVPHTKASCASVLTGLHPTSHGAVDFRGLSEEVVMLPEILRDAGVATFGASANTFISPVFGFQQGFDRLETLPPLVTNKNQLGHVLRRFSRRFGHPAGLEAVRDALLAVEKKWYWTVPEDTVEFTTARVCELFRLWMEDAAREPFFAYLQLIEPHSTYVPPEPWAAYYDSHGYDGEPMLNHPPISNLFAPLDRAPSVTDAQLANLTDRYDAEIAHMDHQLGEFLDWMNAEGLVERTLIVVLGDHGESFYEKGMWGHGHSLWEEELRVPLAVIWPEEVPANGVVTRVVRSVDILPTVLELADVPVPAYVQGESFGAALLGTETEPSPDPPVYSEIEWSGEKSESLRKDGFKLIRAHDGSRWLFDLGADPGERVDLAARHPELVESLTGEMDDFAEFLAASRVAGDGSGEIDDATAERLRALGYIQ
ncbi:MAG TPA: sulfatase [bacterium]|nr:sulfatase [bacterium]